MDKKEKMNKIEEEKKGARQHVNVKITEKSYEQLITLQSLKQLEEKRRVSTSEMLSDMLEREMERVRVEKEKSRKNE